MILIKNRAMVNRKSGMNAHQYGRLAPHEPGFIPAMRTIGELLDDLDYSMSEISEVLDYARRNGTVEGFPFFKKPWHGGIVERILPDVSEDRWSVYDGWRWGTV